MDLVAALQLLALMGAAVGFPMAVLQLYLGRKEARSARDLQVALDLVDSFRVSWDVTTRDGPDLRLHQWPPVDQSAVAEFFLCQTAL